MKVLQNTTQLDLNFLLSKAINYGLPLEEKEKNNSKNSDDEVIKFIVNNIK